MVIVSAGIMTSWGMFQQGNDVIVIVSAGVSDISEFLPDIVVYYLVVCGDVVHELEEFLEIFRGIHLRVLAVPRHDR